MMDLFEVSSDDEEFVTRLKEVINEIDKRKKLNSEKWEKRLKVVDILGNKLEEKNKLDIECDRLEQSIQTLWDSEKFKEYRTVVKNTLQIDLNNPCNALLIRGKLTYGKETDSPLKTKYTWIGIFQGTTPMHLSELTIQESDIIEKAEPIIKKWKNLKEKYWTTCRRRLQVINEAFEDD